MNSDVCINDVLPNEILVTIFESISDSPSNSSPRSGLMRIGSVCHRWRELVQTTRSLQNRLMLIIRSQSQLDQLKLIPLKLRMQPRNLFLQHYGRRDSVSLIDPFWKQMSFESITLDLDSVKTTFEDVIYFFKEYQRNLNHLTLVNCYNSHNWSLCQRNKFMESFSSITSLEMENTYYPFPSGVDKSFSHLVNLQHLEIVNENPLWRLPKHIAHQLKSIAIRVYSRDVHEGFLSAMINLKHISLKNVSNHQIMTFMSLKMPKLEFIKFEDSKPMLGHGFNPKGLPNLKKMFIGTSFFDGDIFETECNVEFVNLKTVIFKNVTPLQIVKFCQQNSGLKRIEIYFSDLEKIPNLTESLFSHVSNLKTFVYDDHLSLEIIGQLTQLCPKLKKLILGGQKKEI